MVVGDKKFGVVSYLLVRGSGVFPQKIFCIFPHLELKCEQFLKQIFWIYSVTLCVDRPNLIS